MMARLLVVGFIASTVCGTALLSQTTTVLVKESFSAARINSGAIVRVAPDGKAIIGLSAADASPELLAIAAFFARRAQTKSKDSKASVLLHVGVTKESLKASAAMLPWAVKVYRQVQAAALKRDSKYGHVRRIELELP